MANTKIPAELSSTPSIVDNGNATAITIDSSENVGIGTTSPSHDLHIQSTDPTLILAQSGSINNANSGRILFAESPSYTTNNAHFEIKYDGLENHLYFGSPIDGSTDLFVVGRDGDVGIGTTSPTGSGTVLHVNGSSTVADFHLTNSTSGAASTDGFVLRYSGLNAEFLNREAGSNIFYTSGTERMRIDSSGDVLIGQTSQTGYAFAQKLVVGDGDNNDGITIQSGSTHQGNLAFNHSDATTAHGRISYQHGTNYMQFFTNNTERLKIDSVGETTIKRAGSGGSGVLKALNLNHSGTSVNDGAKISFTAGSSTEGAGIASTGQALNSADLRFYTGGNTERLRISSNGRTSIGTTSTNAGLTVANGDIRTTNAAFSNDANSFSMSQESSGGTLCARGANSSTRGTIQLSVNRDNGGGGLIGLKVDSSGYVTTPINPAFRARAAANQSLPSSWRQVAYDVLTESRSSGYSTTTSRFTAPVAGWYQFNAQWSATNNTDADGTYSFGINGSFTDLVGSVSMPNTGGSYDGHTISGCCYLDVNDYVVVYRYSTVSTTTRSGNTYGGWFSGFLIG